MARAIDFDINQNDPCMFDATANVPDTGAVFIGEATGKDAGNGNWTAIRVVFTNIDTGSSQIFSARSDSVQVDLPMIVREGGRYRIQAVQSNFRETCNSTTVTGRELDGGFFE